ncbi:MAG: hypothetical protein ACOYLV_11095 [Rubrivivax sp.]|jgi:hypothetical protein
MIHQSQTPSLKAFVEMYAADPRTAQDIGPVVGERYEICENLAQALARQLRDMEHTLGISSVAVRRRIQASLSRQDSIVTSGESEWVLARLSDLLGWFEAEER